MSLEEEKKHLMLLEPGSNVGIKSMNGVNRNSSQYASFIRSLPVGNFDFGCVVKVADDYEGMQVKIGEFILLLPYSSLTCEVIRVVKALDGEK